jgi:predicted DNA-binding transcriptional regulator AlpA
MISNDFDDIRYFQLIQMGQVMSDWLRICNAIADDKNLDGPARMVFRNIRESISAGVENLSSMAKKEQAVNPVNLRKNRRVAPGIGSGRWQKRPYLDPTYQGRTFTIKDLCKLLDCTRQNIYYHMTRNKLWKLPPPYRAGRNRVVWREDDLKSYHIRFPANWQHVG